MCELLAMSANVPTDMCFSFSGLSRRGGETGPHKDGFGVCFYEEGGLREFKDYQSSSDSLIAKFLQEHPIHSRTMIGHIRQANVGHVNLANTHPFQRELWGQHWTFAHNGQMPIEQIPQGDFYQPVGSTDSEKIFCWMLSEVRRKFSEQSPFIDVADYLMQLCNRLNRLGVSNLLLSDGRHLFVFCSTKLCWLTRKAPFGHAHLCDQEMSLDFSQVTNETDVVTVVATAPLTDNEVWSSMKLGEAIVFHEGQELWRQLGPEVQHNKVSDVELQGG